MKSLKVSLIIIAAMALVLGLSGMSFAFHGGGVAHCDGCHSMHNSSDNPVSGQENGALLKGTDATSTCLNCHNGTGSYHVNSADGSNAKEGGDFYWVAQEYYVVVRNNTTYFGGDNAGHNVISTDYGLAADQNPSNAQAPGGTYAASLLGCTSCHDAHGQVHDGTRGGSGPIETSGSYDACKNVVSPNICGNYRLLGDSDYEAGGAGDNYAYSNDAPVAETNGSNGAATDYGYGMSEWCANCHTAYLGGGIGKHVNGATNGYMDTTRPELNIYNSYVATGDYTGTSGTSYDPLVPFERGAGSDHNSLDVVNAQYGGQGPVQASRVMCLTCHRAHATAHENSGRWDLGAEFEAEASAIEAQANGSVPATAAIFYANGATIDIGTQYGALQRNLCNKCHAQD